MAHEAAGRQGYELRTLGAGTLATGFPNRAGAVREARRVAGFLPEGPASSPALAPDVAAVVYVVKRGHRHPDGHVADRHVARAVRYRSGRVEVSRYHLDP